MISLAWAESVERKTQTKRPKRQGKIDYSFRAGRIEERQLKITRNLNKS